jgi:hypothetical protein
MLIFYLQRFMGKEEEFGQSRIHHSLVHDSARLNIQLWWFGLSIDVCWDQL